MLLTRQGYRVLPEGDNTNVIEISTGLDAGDGAHQRRFLEAVRTRKKPVCGIREGHISTATLQLANISYRTGRKVFWDETRQDTAGDPEVSRYLRKDYRKPWSLTA